VTMSGNCPDTAMPHARTVIRVDVEDAAAAGAHGASGDGQQA
jgi:hypothetical protein